MKYQPQGGKEKEERYFVFNIITFFLLFSSRPLWAYIHAIAQGYKVLWWKQIFLLSSGFI